MAEGRDSGNLLSPLEEQYLHESEPNDDDLELQLHREKELASQKLWQTFQESATAVAHLFRDCQQQAGLAAWVPFHESASAVTQLYRDSSEVCKQCTECGAAYGHRKRTKEIVTWAKKKQRYIRREELIAFLLDKPYLENSSSDKLDDFHCELPIVGQKQLTTSTSAIVPPGLGFQSQCGSFMTTSPLPSPSPNRRRALLNKEEASVLESEHFTFGVSGRKRQASGSMCSSSGLSFDFSSTIGSEAPLPKRMRL